ncbi:restriction endonuclease subunit S [Pseudomonas aeruginosa]|uniref:restriction endonuclease subunit S n=2 Tax=Pseudomonas aeruginosa TaxID=287 RepID=UPI00272C477C|nr:restriction endonuclease subunit S [Pseudomonas aeruginosa]
MSWPRVKLSDVATINPRPPREVDESQQVTFVAMASASEDGHLLASETRVLSETKKGFTYFDRNDVLLAKITPCFENGKCLRPGQIPTEIGFGSTEFHVIRPDGERLDGLYLFYLVWSEQFRFLGEKSMSGAAGQKRVGSDFLRGFEIPLPPLPEQKRIAAILDKADAIRRKRQQAIQLADDFLRAVFLDMFGEPVTNPKGWSVREVGDLCDVQGGLQVSKKRAGLPVTAPYLRVANVLRNRLDLTEIKEIELLESEYRRVKLIPDDILIVEGHGNANEIGRCAIWKGEIDEVVHQNHLIRVRVKSKDVNPRFLSDYINSSGGRAQMMRASNSTSGLNTISTGVVRSTGVIVPPKDLQDKYALIVEKTNSNLLRQNFAQVLIGESVFSLSQKAFSGQL